MDFYGWLSLLQEGVLFAAKSRRPHRHNRAGRKHEYNKANGRKEDVSHSVWMKGAMDW
jgi:hypothetical protein